VSSDVQSLSKYIMSKNITIKLIIYIVEAEKHHDNWNSNTETVTDETETLDMLFVFDTEEFTNLFNKLMIVVSDTEQMHKHIIY